MTDSNPVLLPAAGDQPQIVKLGTIAAQNIALVLNLDEAHVDTIERAIGDEINAMSAHFTLAFADIQTSYDLEVAKIKSASELAVKEIKSTFSFIEANKWAVIGVTVAALLLGVLVGVFV